MTEYRAVFDAEIVFRNGGGLQTHGFRLDVPSASVTADEVGQLLVAHLGLLMVESVSFSSFSVVQEPHRGSRAVPATPSPRRLVELNHIVAAGMVTYPGLPGPEISPYLSRADSAARYAPGTTFTIDWIRLLSNTGTYVDSPFHRYEDGADLAGMPLASVADLPTLLVRLSGGSREITPLALSTLVPAGHAVLLHTAWDVHFGTPAYAVHAPFLTAEGAQWLADNGAALVGIDSVNIDSTDGPARPAHSILLRAGIPVVEHLTNLAALPVTGARLHAAPVRVREFGTFPVRAYAVIEASA